MEHQQTNPCSRLGTATGINPVSPLPGAKTRGKKKNPAVSPAAKKSFRFSVENVVALFYFLTSLPAGAFPALTRKQGQGIWDVSSKWHQELPPPLSGSSPVAAAKHSWDRWHCRLPGCSHAPSRGLTRWNSGSTGGRN